MTDMNVKYQRLAQEYAKLKAQNQVLKKAVVEAKESTEKLQIDLQNKEQVIRRSQQEIDSSSFRSEQMECRIQMLQVELEQKAHSKHGKVAVERNSVDGLSAIDEDLQNKIYENELLHKKVDEYDTKKRQLEQSLNDQIACAKNEARVCSEALQALQEKHDKLTKEYQEDKQILQRKFSNAENNARQASEESQASVIRLIEMNTELEKNVQYLSQNVQDVVVFNDSSTTDYSKLRVASHNKRCQVQTEETISAAKDLVKEFCSALKSFHLHTKQRCLLYPHDSNFESPSACNRKLSEHLGQNHEIIQSVLTAFDDAFGNLSFPLSLQSACKIEGFTKAFQIYVSYLSKLHPYILASLKEECELSLCAPTLQFKNTEFLSNYQRLLPAMSKICTYLSFITSSRSEDCTTKDEFAYQKIISALNELHLTFKDLSKTFNSKIVLEYQLPTTSKSPELRSANEFLLSSMLSLASISAKLSGFIHNNIEFFIQSFPTNRNSAMNLLNIVKKSVSYLDAINSSSAPVSVSYLDALNKRNDVHNENMEELFDRLQQNANQLQTLEQEKEHWLLETQLLQMKLDKQKLSDIDNEQTVPARARSASIQPVDVSMLGNLDVSNSNAEMLFQTTEDMIKQHMTSRLTESGLKIQSAEGKALHFENECRALHKHLTTLHKKKQGIHDELDKSSQRVAQLQDELSVTRRNYEEQLSLMSEHLAAMNDKLTVQKDEIDTLKVKKTSKKTKILGLH